MFKICLNIFIKILVAFKISEQPKLSITILAHSIYLFLSDSSVKIKQHELGFDGIYFLGNKKNKNKIIIHRFRFMKQGWVYIYF